MKKKQGLLIILLLLIVIAAAIIYTLQKLSVNLPQPDKNTTEASQNYCPQGMNRTEKFCIEMYKPVCGWSDPAKVQCFRYPCAQTYSNDCFACNNPDVLYWTEGTCPSG